MAASSRTPRQALPKASAKPALRRKNLNIDQKKLNLVHSILGARTETEAVDQALDIVLFRQELVRGIRRIAGSGGVENVFDGDREP
ncbi:MAG: hypothetical protein FJY95_11295 [Candidatus Handelsmanbacteria bacterium]|nr:hypothetical protein [Candidatus Handelsmanbacteria bacterium]